MKKLSFNLAMNHNMKLKQRISKNLVIFLDKKQVLHPVSVNKLDVLIYKISMNISRG